MDHIKACVLSVAAPEDIGALTRKHYALGEVTECLLLRSYVNDVYSLVAGGQRYILKLYRQGWRSREEILYEIELLLHVCERGISVALPLASREGSYLRDVLAPEGLRHYCLYAYAEGTKPAASLSDALYAQTGGALGCYHRAARDFTSGYARKRLTAGVILEDFRRLYRGRADAKVEAVVLATEQYFAGVERRLTRSVCHGDYTLDNLHKSDEGGITLFDFDSCGEGYAAYDLLGAYLMGKLVGPASYWEHHLQAYQEEMPLNEDDLCSLPYLKLLYDLWDLNCRAALWTRTSGTWRAEGEGLKVSLRSLCDWHREECGGR